MWLAGSPTTSHWLPRIASVLEVLVRRRSSLRSSTRSRPQARTKPRAFRHATAYVEALSEKSGAGASGDFVLGVPAVLHGTTTVHARRAALRRSRSHGQCFPRRRSRASEPRRISLVAHGPCLWMSGICTPDSGGPGPAQKRLTRAGLARGLGSTRSGRRRGAPSGRSCSRQTTRAMMLCQMSRLSGRGQKGLARPPWHQCLARPPREWLVRPPHEACLVRPPSFAPLPYYRRLFECYSVPHLQKNE
jgi:hypothetical protein